MISALIRGWLYIMNAVTKPLQRFIGWVLVGIFIVFVFCQFALSIGQYTLGAASTIACSYQTVSIASRALPLFGLQDFCATKRPTELPDMPDDPTGAKEISKWSDYSEGIELARDASEQTALEIRNFVAEVEWQQGHLPDADRIGQLASDYKQSHETSEELLDILLRQHNGFRQSVLIDIRSLQTSIRRYQTQFVGISTFWETVYSWMPFWFNRSPIGKILLEFEEFAKWHEPPVKSLHTNAETLQRSLKKESDARSSLKSAMSRQWPRWEKACIEWRRSWKKMYVAEAVVAGEAPFCEDVDFATLKQFLDHDTEIWFKRAGEIAINTAQGYSRLLTQYAATLSALRHRRISRSSKEFHLDSVEQTLATIEHNMEVSEQRLETGLKGEKPLRIDAPKSYIERNRRNYPRAR